MRTMEDHCIYEYPATLDLIINDTQKMGFDMASEPKTGSILRAIKIILYMLKTAYKFRFGAIYL